MYKASFAIVFVLFFTGITSEKCDQAELMRCSTPLPGLGSPADLSIGLTKEDLDKNCIELQAGIRCITNYTDHCMTPVERRRFNSMYEGVHSVMRSLCQPGRYQEDYLRHAACIKRVKPEYEMCSKNYEHTLTSITQEGEHPRDTEYLRTVCCSFQEYLLCSERMVKQTCGDEAAAFTSVFLTRMSSNIIKSFCLEYRGSECGLPSSAPREGLSWLVLTTIACSITLLAHLSSVDPNTPTSGDPKHRY